MQGFEGKIYYVAGATVILNPDGWGMYILVGDKAHTFIGWPYDKHLDGDNLPLTTPEFENFLATADTQEIVGRLTGVHMTLYRSENEVREELTGIVAELQRGLAENMQKQQQIKTSA